MIYELYPPPDKVSVTMLPLTVVVKFGLCMVHVAFADDRNSNNAPSNRNLQLLSIFVLIDNVLIRLLF